MAKINRQGEKSSQSKLVILLRDTLELIFRLVDENKTFYDTRQFDWVKLLEENYNDIKRELVAVLESENIPSWIKVSSDPNVNVGDKWKSYVFCAYGNWVDKNVKTCPNTCKILKEIECVRTAWFSILEPNTSLPSHSGPYSGVLRYHLGLIIPSENIEECGIRVGTEKRNWIEGGSLIFDDSHNHEVWNKTNFRRAVLFVDIERPLPFPVSILNKLVLYFISKNSFIKKLILKSSEI